MSKISLCMIVKNEEKTLKRCLESIKPYVDEMIIVDTGSTDQTKKIALSFTPYVFDFQWSNDFSAARNFSIKQATGEWILVLDADEYIVQWKKEQIEAYMQNPSVGKIQILSPFIHKNDIQTAKNFISRLFPKGIYYTGKIHEQIASDLPRTLLPITVHHDGYFETDKSGRNIPILVESLSESPSDDYLLYQLSKEYKGIDEFHKSFLYLEKAYKIVPKTAGHYPHIVVDLLYLSMDMKKIDFAMTLIENEEKYLCNFPDFLFACALFYMHIIIDNPTKYIDKFPLIEQLYLTCLTIGDDHLYDGVMGTGSFLAAYNLGTFYETLGFIDKAKECYVLSSRYQYKPAVNRFSLFK